MADPDGYEPQYDFSAYQAANPKRPLPGHELDVELHDISNAIGSTQTALADIRRSDGRLQNGIVDADAIGPTAVGALIEQSTELMEDVLFVVEMYLGQLAEDPETGRDGADLEPSNWYYSTVTEGYRYYTADGWRPMTGVATIRQYRFIMEAGQTDISGLDENGFQYFASGESVAVFKNGAILPKTTGFTTPDNSTITLASAASDGDVVVVLSFEEAVPAELGRLARRLHVADGTTATFALPTGVTSIGQVLSVAVDGVAQNYDTYSMVGSDLVLDAMPRNGERVQITAWTAVLAEDSNTRRAYAFASRAALVAALGWSWESGAVVSDGAVEYIKVAPAAMIADMPGWAPYRTIAPNHFAENTVPGTTDMDVAVQAAITYAIAASGVVAGGVNGAAAARVDFLDQKYYLASRSKWASTDHRVEMHGNGAYVITDANTALFRGGDDVIFDSADAAGSQACYGWVVTGFTFRNTNNTATASRCLEFGRAWNFRVEGNTFVDFDIAVDLYGSGHSGVRNNKFFIRNRSTVDSTAFIRHQGVVDSTNTGRLTGSGLSIFDNEFSGHPTQPDRLLATWEIKSMDALYFGGNHMSWAKTHILISPTGSDNNYRNNTVIDLLSSGANYLDDHGTGPQVLVTGEVAYDGAVTGVGTRALGRVSNIVFLPSDKFRGNSAASNAIALSLADGSLTPGDYMTNRGLPSIAIAGDFSDHVSSHVSALGASSSKIPWSVALDQVKSYKSKTGAVGGTSLAYQEGGVLKIGDHVTTGAEVNAPLYLVTYNGDGGEGLGWGVTVGAMDAMGSTFSGGRPVNLSNTSDVLVDIGDIKTSLVFGRTETRSFSAQLANAGPSLPLIYSMPATSTVAIRFVAVGDSTGAGTADRFAHVEESLVVRRSGATSTVIRNTKVSKDLSTGWAINAYPASIVALFGTAWAATTAYALGDTHTNGGNVYLCVIAGTSGATGPVATSGIEVDGTASWVYCGAVTANALAVVLSGISGYDMRWSGKIEMIGV